MAYLDETKCTDKLCVYKNHCKRFIEKLDPDTIVFLFPPRSNLYCNKYLKKEEVIDVIYQVIGD